MKIVAGFSTSIDGKRDRVGYWCTPPYEIGGFAGWVRRRWVTTLKA